MGRKIFTYAWKKRNKFFYSVRGVKRAFAWELLLFDIKIPKRDNKVEALKNPIRYLESHGWEWVKLTDKEKAEVNENT